MKKIDMKKTKWRIWQILTLLIIVASSGYYFWFWRMNQREILINKDYNYSISYPSHFTKNNFFLSHPLNDHVSLFSKKVYYDGSCHSTDISGICPGITIVVKSLHAYDGTFEPGTDLRDWIKNNYQKKIRAPFLENDDIEPTSINGLDGYYYKFSCLNTSQPCLGVFAVEGFIFENKGVIYKIDNVWGFKNFEDNVPDDFKISHEDFMKMVKSFKLIDLNKIINAS